MGLKLECEERENYKKKEEKQGLLATLVSRKV